jgi:uncharacterized protein
MSDLSLSSALTIVATFILAGIVKGATGMGLPTVAMGLLGAIMAPVEAATLLIIPSFVTNIWQLFSGPSFLSLARRLWAMMAGIVVGALAGSRILTSGHTTGTTIGLGVALALYAGISLLGRQFRISPRTEAWLSPLVGLTTGLITGGTGVFVIPAVPFLQSLGLEKEDLIQALGLSFTISTVALALALIWGGAFEAHSIAASFGALAPALFGMWLGQAIRLQVSPATFRRWFLICLLALGCELAARPFV